MFILEFLNIFKVEASDDVYMIWSYHMPSENRISQHQVFHNKPILHFSLSENKNFKLAIVQIAYLNNSLLNWTFLVYLKTSQFFTSTILCTLPAEVYLWYMIFTLTTPKRFAWRNILVALIVGWFTTSTSITNIAFDIKYLRSRIFS